ncbi:glucose 1-dehydrogenase [Streptomyces sp. GbtcB7]|uniref:glucose 1-dehydrogenase n=1 Tax=Streptomyces sp. GbtcB7 TaxID=2824752 RepID=UPI0020C625EB|nr:glucose 1-dehydrogenase [Streptomyces sp. GbtcB7]
MKGKAGLVTGAAGGIGRASAVAFGRAGAAVVVADLDIRRADGLETVRLVEKAGGRALFAACDVTDADDCTALARAVVEAYGRLDFAHNNAGIGAQGSITHTDEAAFDRCLAVNLKGVWHGLRAQIPPMAAAGGGAIVNTASLAGLTGLPQGAAYSASKHAVVGLTKTAAIECAERNIRVNAVCPAAVHTAMTASLPPELQAQVVAPQALKRFAEPEEVAAAVVWLCSDAASFITGTAMPVDAGATAS